MLSKVRTTGENEAATEPEQTGAASIAETLKAANQKRTLCTSQGYDERRKSTHIMGIWRVMGRPGVRCIPGLGVYKFRVDHDETRDTELGYTPKLRDVQ